MQLVTGANGHVGSHVVRELVSKGVAVRGLVRTSSDLRTLKDVPVDLVNGDVTDPASLRTAMDGCDVVYHTAAVYKMWAKDAAEIVAPAVEGAKAVFAAAKDAGVKRIVYTSSIAAIGYGTTPDTRLDETSWNEDYKNPYYRAKTESERVAHDLARQSGVEIVVVCPSVVVGPLDYRITPSTGMVQGLLSGQPTFAGGYCWVGVADVARAHVLAAEKGRAGERYLASGTNASVEESAAALHRLAGDGGTNRKLPSWLIGGLGTVAGAVARVTGGRPFVDPDVLHEVLDKYAYFDHGKATRELGWEPAGLDTVLGETLRWLAFRKALPDALVGPLQQRYPRDPAWVE